MPDVVDSDALDPGLFRTPLYLPVEIALSDSKHPIMRPNAVEHFEIVLDFICQKLRHGDDAVALFRLGGSNQVLAIQPLVRLVDRYGALLEVKICWGQSQQLPLSDTAPVEHLKGVEGQRLVHHHLGKFQVLFLGPEHHLPVFLFAHAPGLFTGILPQIVIPHRVIEDGGELVVDRFQVHRRIGLAVLVLVVQHLVLPGDNLLSGDVAHFQPAEVGQQLGTDDVVFGCPGVLLKPSFHIRCVEIHEALKCHIQISTGLVELFPLPSLRLPLGLEAPLLGLLALAVSISIAVDYPPGVGLFFLIDCHD